MLGKIEALSRHVVGNRRREPRRRIRYTAIVRDTIGREIFRGRTVNLSRRGVRLSGFVSGLGIADGQNVRVDFLVLPKDYSETARRHPVKGIVRRLEDAADDSALVVVFDKPLAV